MMILFIFDEINQVIIDIIVKNNLKFVYICFIVFYGDIGMGLQVLFGQEIEVIIVVFEWGVYLGEEVLKNGVNVGIFLWNCLVVNIMFIGVKVGGNYLFLQLILMEVCCYGYGEGIVLDCNGYISEGVGENIFVICNGVISIIFKIVVILLGIMCDIVIILVKDLGYEICEENILCEVMYLVDEILMCGIVVEVIFVSSVDGIIVGKGGCGLIMKEIQDMFFGLFNGIIEDKWNWLILVYK